MVLCTGSAMCSTSSVMGPLPVRADAKQHPTNDTLRREQQQDAWGQHCSEIAVLSGNRCSVCLCTQSPLWTLKTDTYCTYACGSTTSESTSLKTEATIATTSGTSHTQLQLSLCYHSHCQASITQFPALHIQQFSLCHISLIKPPATRQPPWHTAKPAGKHCHGGRLLRLLMCPACEPQYIKPFACGKAEWRVFIGSEPSAARVYVLYCFSYAWHHQRMRRCYNNQHAGKHSINAYLGIPACPRLLHPIELLFCMSQ